MKKFFRPLAIFVAMILISQLFVIGAVAESGNCGSDVTYSLDTSTGKLVLSGTGATYDFVKLDEGEDGWTPSFKPGDKFVPWRRDVDSIKSVAIVDGITGIGNNAFSQCYNIEKIVFLSKDVQISSSAFDSSKSEYTIYLYRNSTADEYFSSDKYTKVYLDEVLFGDANGDGDLNISDAVLMSQFIAEWSVDIDEIASDCNADGYVNIMDVVLLVQRLAGWSVTLG